MGRCPLGETEGARGLSGADLLLPKGAIRFGFACNAVTMSEIEPTVERDEFAALRCGIESLAWLSVRRSATSSLLSPQASPILELESRVTANMAQQAADGLGVYLLYASLSLVGSLIVVRSRGFLSRSSVERLKSGS
jgi:hypothetical protein